MVVRGFLLRGEKKCIGCVPSLLPRKAEIGSR